MTLNDLKEGQDVVCTASSEGRNFYFKTHVRRINPLDTDYVKQVAEKCGTPYYAALELIQSDDDVPISFISKNLLCHISCASGSGYYTWDNVRMPKVVLKNTGHVHIAFTDHEAEWHETDMPCGISIGKNTGISIAPSCVMAGNKLVDLRKDGFDVIIPQNFQISEDDPVQLQITSDDGTQQTIDGTVCSIEPYEPKHLLVHCLT